MEILENVKTLGVIDFIYPQRNTLKNVCIYVFLPSHFSFHYINTIMIIDICESFTFFSWDFGILRLLFLKLWKISLKDGNRKAAAKALAFGSSLLGIQSHQGKAMGNHPCEKFLRKITMERILSIGENHDSSDIYW